MTIYNIVHNISNDEIDVLKFLERQSSRCIQYGHSA